MTTSTGCVFPVPNRAQAEPKVVVTLVSTVSYVIGVGDEQIEVERPEPSARDLRRARRAGWVDRVRQRHVEDGRHTHYLHAAEHDFRSGEARVVAAVEHGLSHIEVRLAALAAVRSTALPEAVVEPVVQDLMGATGPSRQRWADDLRTARKRNARTATARGERSAAEARFEELLASRQALLAEGEAVSRLWREAFSEIAGVYTRARFGLFGRRPSADPRIPTYRPTDRPEPDRGRDPRSASVAPVRTAQREDEEEREAG